VKDAGLECLKGLSQLRSLSLHGVEVTDAGLQNLKGLTQLQSLDLERTKVTDAGLEILKGFAKLQSLNLFGTSVTDAGLRYLDGLPNLQPLDLSHTKVTDAGLEHLKGLTALQTLSLASTDVTDAGLLHLKGLTNLRMLNLSYTRVTDAGVRDLRKALPSCQINSRELRAATQPASSPIAHPTEPVTKAQSLMMPPPGVSLPTVTVTHPVVREVSDYEDFVGRTEAARTVEIRAAVTGTLGQVRFRGGAAVERNEVLFTIDPRSYQADVEKHRAEVQLAQERRKHLARELDASKAAPSYPRQRAESELAEAEAALKAAEAGLQVASLHLAETTLTTPIDGVIGDPLVSPGNLVQANTTLLATIHSVDPMGVSFDVDQRTVLELRRKNVLKATGEPALPIAVGLADEKDFPHHGKLDSADARFDPATGNAHWRALCPNADGLLMPGMFVRVRLLTSAPHKALLISEQALCSDQGQRFVYVVTNKMVEHEKNAGALGFTARERQFVVEYRRVKAGRSDDGLRVVEAGLTTDDRVVVSGLQGLRPGMRVRVEEVSPSPASPSAPAKP
jgi:RND family efflux transporter MFP subunit